MPVALAVLLFPLGLWRLSVRQQDALGGPGLNRCRAVVKPWQFSASVKAGHPAPEASLNWLHASVTGVVPSLADRDSIRQQLDDLKGIQCEESGIATLRVMPSLNARREGPVLHLSGEVSLTETISDAVALLTKAEPGLTVDSAGVVVHPAVLAVSMPTRAQDGAASPVLAKVWPAVNFAWPALAFDLEQLPPRLSGTFPDTRLRDAVVAALKTSRPDLNFEASNLKIDNTLPPVDFSPPETPDWQPPIWLASEWNRWHVFPSLRLRQDRYDVKLDGIIPSQALQKNILTLLHRLRPDIEFAKGNLQVRNGSLDKPLLLPSSLKDWIPPAWLRPVVTQVSQLPAKSAAAAAPNPTQNN